MIKVSIIVPVYNVEKYLTECLNSLVGQTLKDIEIVAVNDGSKDNSLRILEEYAEKDKRIKIINQKNAGLSAARNRGVEAATGEFVAFIDSDDWVDLDFCEKLYTAATEEKADIAAGELVWYENPQKNVKQICYKRKLVCKGLKEKYYKLLNGSAYCYVCNKIYRRETLIKSGVVFPEGKVYEDMHWSPRVMCELGKAVAIGGVSYYYRQNVSSITHLTPQNEKMAKDYRDARAALVKFADMHNLIVSFSMWKKIYFRILGLPLAQLSYGDTGVRFYFLGICLFEKRVRVRF